MEEIEFLNAYKSKKYGGPTSMVSLIIPGNTNLDQLRQRMSLEYQTASNIKNNTNRKSVRNALSSIKTTLKSLRSLPSTGLALFSEQYI